MRQPTRRQVAALREKLADAWAARRADRPATSAGADADPEPSADAPAARAVSTGSPDIETLEAEARYARERYDLYRAKTYGPRPTSLARLRELQRIHAGADARVRRARRAQAAKAGD